MKYAILLAIAALTLASCSTKIDTRVMSSGAQNAAAARYILVPPAQLASPAYDQAGALVTQKLSAMGYEAAQDGSLYLEVGIASRPASLALKEAGKLLGPASTKRGSSRCKWNEYRLTVALTRIADGAEIYRGAAGEYHCKENIETVLPLLVDAALADLGNPKGEYVNSRWVKRPLFQ
ncbi:hypothetical protein ACFOWX_00370 [Sphingorhabdus arenilitoris]|uniref:DUF4136 domain-containing protein n=1 Tax=Sphingorhabdus arenilitoris TaxID=1490041 RepID=A0ABV8RDV3_9SPHN